MNDFIPTTQKHTDSDEVRFWTKVDVRGIFDCWEWQAGKTSTGYGKLYWRERIYGAHRVSWEIHNGSIPEDMYVCHYCDNRACVNPVHLFLGTPKDNMVDMTKKGRCNTSKLTPHDVLIIRRAVRWKIPYRKIAKHFGVAHATIREAAIGKQWAHIDKPVAKTDIRNMQGENNPRAKLTENDIHFIRRAVRFGIPHSKIARRFGITSTTVNAIKKGHRWKHIS